MASVGDMLRMERERKGYTFKDVEKTTCIRAIYIEAIEQGNFKIIPGAVYCKGFIRSYARFLEMDGEALVRIYKDVVGEDTRVVNSFNAFQRRKKEKEVDADNLHGCLQRQRRYGHHSQFHAHL